MVDPVTWYVHVNRNTIDSNRKHHKSDPPIKVQRGRYGQSMYFNSVELPAGSRIVYSADEHLLPCGARLVIECDEAPVGSI